MLNLNMIYQAQHGVIIESIDRGVAIGRFEDTLSPDRASLYTLSYESSAAAIASALTQAGPDIAFTAQSCEIRYDRVHRGSVTAVAAVALEIVDDFVADVASGSRNDCQVTAIVVDDDGHQVARASFEWLVERPAS